MTRDEDTFERRERHRVKTLARSRLFGGAVEPMQIGRYVIRSRLGEGAFGIVYLAFDEALARSVAVKVLARAGDAGAEDRMLREARAMASLTHVNVVPIYDVGTFDGRTYIAMRYAEGPTLRDWVERERPPTSAVLSAYVAAGRGLAAAHAVGLVHRDFKPENVFRDEDGNVLVGDFGLARSSDDSDVASFDRARSDDLTLTATGHLLGTPSYLAPEVVRGKAATAKSDQFAFAVALSEALDGEHPFKGTTPAARMRAIALGKRRAGPARGPRAVRRALRRAMSVEPDDRFADLDALLDALRERSRAPWVAGVVAATSVAALAFATTTRVDSPAVASADSPPVVAPRPRARDASVEDAGVDRPSVRDAGAPRRPEEPPEARHDAGAEALAAGDYARAISIYEVRRSEVERRHGARSSALIAPTLDLARACFEANEKQDALRWAKAALDLAERFTEASPGERQAALVLVAFLQLHDRDERSRASATLERVRAGAPVAGRSRTELLWAESIVLRRERKLRPAIERLQSAQASVERGSMERRLLPLLVGEGTLWIALRQPQRAAAALERAVQVGDRPGSTNLDLARAQFYLAMALGDLDRDPSRAVALARRAKASFEAHGVVNARIDDWLDRAGAR
ncbi:MAG: protein kinase [Deltaproteobacteria bacterium]